MCLPIGSYMGKSFDKRLRDLGATPFLPSAFADEATNMEETVEPWLTSLYPSLLALQCRGGDAGNDPQEEVVEEGHVTHVGGGDAATAATAATGSIVPPGNSTESYENVPRGGGDGGSGSGSNQDEGVVLPSSTNDNDSSCITVTAATAEAEAMASTPSSLTNETKHRQQQSLQNGSSRDDVSKKQYGGNGTSNPEITASTTPPIAGIGVGVVTLASLASMEDPRGLGQTATTAATASTREEHGMDSIGGGSSTVTESMDTRVIPKPSIATASGTPEPDGDDGVTTAIVVEAEAVSVPKLEERDGADVREADGAVQATGALPPHRCVNTAKRYSWRFTLMVHGY